jgi:hypothetical protein
VGSKDAWVCLIESFRNQANDPEVIELNWQDSKVDQERYRQKHKCIYGQERSSLPSLGQSSLPLHSKCQNKS